MLLPVHICSIKSTQPLLSLLILHLLFVLLFVPPFLLFLFLLSLFLFFPFLLPLLFLVDVVTIQLFNRQPKKLNPKCLGLVLMPAELLVQPPYGSLAEAILKVVQKVGRVLVAFVPVCTFIATNARLSTHGQGMKSGTRWQENVN